jgi:sphinganine C4-monooxygenase
METWQYWLHRLFHTFHFLYRHLHSWHHQIYVPYAFAALYAHPIEALLLNIFGAALGFSLPHLTTRMGIVLFVGSTCKAVDDHSGYRWPRFGPREVFCLNLFQCVFGENSEFHDLHHHVRFSLFFV